MSTEPSTMHLSTILVPSPVMSLFHNIYINIYRVYPFCLSCILLLLFFFFFFLLLARSNIGERRTRGKRKKIKELGSCLEKDRKEEDGEEAHSVRETGCGQLFTSWRMIPCGVPLQNASSPEDQRANHEEIFR